MGDRVSPSASPSAIEVRMQMRVMREALIARKVSAYEINSVTNERVIGMTVLRSLHGWMGTSTAKDDILRIMMAF